MVPQEFRYSAGGLQVRSREFTVDHQGCFCGMTEFGPWKHVQIDPAVQGVYDSSEQVTENWLVVIGAKTLIHAEMPFASFVGWSTSRMAQIGPWIEIRCDDSSFQLFVDRKSIPGVFLKTRSDVRRLLQTFMIPIKEG